MEAMIDGGKTETRTQLNVVFDTNVYRRLVQRTCIDSESIRDYAGQLRSRERSLSNRAFAHPIVMLELLAHMSKPSDPWHAECAKAVSLLVLHCHAEEDERCLSMIATSEMQILEMLFGDVPPGFEESAQHSQRMCYMIADAYLSTGDAGQACEAVDAEARAWMARAIQERIDTYNAAWKLVALSRAATGSEVPEGEWRRQQLKVLRTDQTMRRFAREWVLRAVRQAGKTLTDGQVLECTDRILQSHRVSLEIHREMCVRSLGKGFGMDNPKRKRANTMWDMDIASIVGNGHEMEDGPLILVTDDKAIIIACDRAACRTNVMRMAEYLTSIGLPM